VAQPDTDGDDDSFFLDRWADMVMSDPKLRGLLLRWFWLTSLAFLLLGFALMLLVIMGRSPF
jgi:cytochrome c-type biogenesis protein CcmH/NrfF